MSKYPLLGMTLAELQSVVRGLGMPGFAAKQIASWLYDKKVATIDEMTNLSLKHREALKADYEVGGEAPVDAMHSVDGTIKYLYRVGENHFVEAVYIPDDDRATLCVSSQVGCKMNCKFCMTGKQGFTANLTSNQILNQINSLPECDKLTNIVMMGMGEPLDNLDEVLKALEILTASYGYAWSPKRVTLSTVGLRKGLQRFIEESDCHLAISLHSPLLKADYEVGGEAPVDAMHSVDGTIKYLYRVGENHFVEAVYIPDDDRATLCVSSQVGCKMNCKFCMTGKQGFTANLTSNQILNQINSLPECDKLTNIVMMGMGEPLDNLDEVLKALEILTASYGYAWSPKRVTLSTVGLRKGLQRFIEESDCHLAISLHSPLPSQRSDLMPAERAFSIVEIVNLLKNYDFSKQRRLSFEYIVFRGVNDSLIYAKELVKLLRGLDCRMNLIRFHAIPDVDLNGADMETMTAFRDYLTSHGLFSTIRSSRGEDIFAACGMLSTAKQEENNKN